MINSLNSALPSLQASTPDLQHLASGLSSGKLGSAKNAAAAKFESTIQSTASEFESIFLSLMLKEMRNTLDQEEGGLFGGEGSDTLGGMFDMFMSQHLAESNPLGIGAAIEKYMQNSLSE